MIDLIKKNIREVLAEIQLDKNFGDSLVVEEIKVEITDTKNYKFGDYSTNVAMILAGKLQQNSLRIAEDIAERLRKNGIKNIDKIEVVTPGYINFYLTKKYIFQEIEKIFEAGDDWGKSKRLKAKKYIFEHSSPNLFKPFHIGHLVNNSIGEALVRLLKNAGADVKTISFPSDVSPGIAKTVWAIKKKGWEEKMSIDNIGKAYVFGGKKYIKDVRAKKEIDEINKKIYQQEKFDGWEVYKKGQEISLAYFKKITKKLGTDFDDLIFESEAEKIGKKIVQENIPDIFTKSKGAIIFVGSKYGLFDDVFINSAGFGTYLAKDIGLLKIKFDKFSFDKSIAITDVEQREHFLMVRKVAELINKKWAEKSEFVQHGRLRFAGGKVSSRFGNVPLAEDLINSVKEKVFVKISQQRFSSAENEKIANKIAIGALKYSILKSSAGKNIIFDFKKSIAFEGDSGPYLQYAFVRTNSILKKVQSFSKIKFLKRKGGILDLEKMLLKFPSVLEKSIESYSPHHLTNYLYQVASEFNSFYAQEKILDIGNKNYSANLFLVKNVNTILKNGLNLLGIETVEKM